MASHNINYFGFGDIFKMSFSFTIYFRFSLILSVQMCCIYYKHQKALTITISLRFFHCLCRMKNSSNLFLCSTDSFLEHGNPSLMQNSDCFWEENCNCCLAAPVIYSQNMHAFDTRFSFLLLVMQNILKFIRIS